MAISAEPNNSPESKARQYEKRDAFKQEALGSWSLYQETSQHLTGQEVHDWLDKWETEQEADIPPCHD